MVSEKRDFVVYERILTLERAVANAIKIENREYFVELENRCGTYENQKCVVRRIPISVKCVAKMQTLWYDGDNRRLAVALNDYTIRVKCFVLFLWLRRLLIPGLLYVVQ